MNWKDNIRRVVPYVPGEQPKRENIIKLNTNENPYPPSPKVDEVLMEVETGALRKYPDPEVSGLTQAIASYHGLSKDQVFVGVGSDDVLAMSFLTFFNSKHRPVFFPDITYSFYDVWAELFRIDYETKPLNDDFRIDSSDYDMTCGGIVIPNPNAPTGLAEPVEFFEDIIRIHDECVIIIDEAYVDFGAQSCIKLIDKYPNVLVVRTFSKSRSLAGSRIGYALGSKELIKYLNDCKFSFNSYTMDSVTQAIGVASVEDDTYFNDAVAKVVATREWTKKELKRLGFSFPDSSANFIFATHEQKKAKDIFEALKERGIYVRYFNKPRIDNHLRITIGTDKEMQALITALEEILGEIYG